jgi:hypothetical protein
MRIAIHQPNYIPYPGFFAKLGLSDIFVIYDTAQFTRCGFINRNRIRKQSPNGCMWLTLPVGKKDYKEVSINQVKIAENRVFEQHSKILKYMYSKAPFFDKEICEVLATPHLSLSDHNVSIILFLTNRLRIRKPQIVLSSELNIPIRHATEGIIDIVKALGGTEYISGTGAKNYLKPELIEKEGIKLSFSNYEPLRYKQIHPGFVENMSIVDAVFNMGWEETAARIPRSLATSQRE